MSGDRVRVTVSVAVDPPVAWEVFTEEIELWWRHGPRYRMGARGVGRLALEPRLGGRVFETVGEKTHEIGTITTWEPPSRLVLSWRAQNFAKDERTEVEVRFAPAASGTVVTLEHRGWSAIRPDHPARHGATDAVFLRTMGSWWSDLATSLREHAATR